jgi:hypothetical protein
VYDLILCSLCCVHACIDGPRRNRVWIGSHANLRSTRAEKKLATGGSAYPWPEKAPQVRSEVVVLRMWSSYAGVRAGQARS